MRLQEPPSGAQPGSQQQPQHAQQHHPQSHQEEMAATLAEVAQYLAKQGMAGGGALAPTPTDPASIAADSSRFRWVAVVGV
jgi:hypothetical protein